MLSRSFVFAEYWQILVVRVDIQVLSCECSPKTPPASFVEVRSIDESYVAVDSGEIDQ